MAVAPAACVERAVTPAGTPASVILRNMAGHHGGMGKLVSFLPKVHLPSFQVSSAVYAHPGFPLPGNDQNRKRRQRRRHGKQVGQPF